MDKFREDLSKEWQARPGTLTLRAEGFTCRKRLSELWDAEGRRLMYPVYQKRFEDAVMTLAEKMKLHCLRTGHKRWHCGLDTLRCRCPELSTQLIEVGVH